MTQPETIQPETIQPEMERPDIQHWLLTEGRCIDDLRDLLFGLIERMNGAGLEIGRITLGQRTLHPEVARIAFWWKTGETQVHRAPISHDVQQSTDYLMSPVRIIYEGGGTEVRCRLEGPDPNIEYSFLENLIEEGFTDYVALAVPLCNGLQNPMTLATRRPGGFKQEEIDWIGSFMPVLGLITEIHAGRQLAAGLLDVYLGHGTGERVLAGAVQRGGVRRIPAAVFFCDLRGFTALSEKLPRDHIVHVLNDYFDAVGVAIGDEGGEILKFIGDAALAIFRVDEAGQAAACDRALRAARATQKRLSDLNQVRAEAGKPPLKTSIGLHAGDVWYGNIGASGRLDFTVIGPAVNRAARLEQLASSLAEPILVTAEFANAADGRFKALGDFALKGIDVPVDVFMPLADE